MLSKSIGICFLDKDWFSRWGSVLTIRMVLSIRIGSHDKDWFSRLRKKISPPGPRTFPANVKSNILRRPSKLSEHLLPVPNSKSQVIPRKPKRFHRILAQHTAQRSIIGKPPATPNEVKNRRKKSHTHARTLLFLQILFISLGIRSKLSLLNKSEKSQISYFFGWRADVRIFVDKVTICI